MQLIIIIKIFDCRCFLWYSDNNNKRCCHSLAARCWSWKTGVEVMLYTAEDAIQIYHAKSSTLEFFAASAESCLAGYPQRRYWAGSGILQWRYYCRFWFAGPGRFMKKRSAAVLIAICPMRRFLFWWSSSLWIKNFFILKNDLCRYCAYKGRFFWFTSTVSGGLRALKCNIQPVKMAEKVFL